MDWAKDFIRRALAGIPNSTYKHRLRCELTDHLTQLSTDLEAVGNTPEEARREALRQMGDAQALSESYYREWLRQPERRRWDLGRMVCGCVIAGVFSFFAFVVLGTLWDIRSGPLRAAPMWIFGALLFVCAAVPDALFLRAAFRGRTDRCALVIFGMLLMWCVGTGGMLLGFGALYGQVFPLPAYNHRLLGTPDGFWVKGSFRWFTNSYMAWTLAATLLTGWLFSAGKRGRPNGQESG